MYELHEGISFFLGFSLAYGSNLLKYGEGYVCDDAFSINSARVACVEMGYYAVKSYSTSQRVPVAKFSMDDLSCSGGASRLNRCTFRTSHNCGVSEGVKVFCSGK